MRRAQIEARTDYRGQRVAPVARVGWNDLPVSGTPADALAQLTNMAAERRRLDERTRVTVQELRSAGASWTVIGDALGVSRSAAQKRYGADELPL